MRQARTVTLSEITRTKSELQAGCPWPADPLGSLEAGAGQHKHRSFLGARTALASGRSLGAAAALAHVGSTSRPVQGSSPCAASILLSDMAAVLPPGRRTAARTSRVRAGFAIEAFRDRGSILDDHQLVAAG